MNNSNEEGQSSSNWENYFEASLARRSLLEASIGCCLASTGFSREALQTLPPVVVAISGVHHSFADGGVRAYVMHGISLEGR